MTLKNSVLVAFAAITLISMNAGAYVIPGQPRPPEPAPYPGDDRYQPSYPYPGRDDFGHGRSGRQEQKVIYLHRQVANETLALRQLAGINEAYRGYELESVVVQVRRSGPQAEVILLTDGREQDSFYSPQGAIQLYPQNGDVIGQDFRTLQLVVRGVVEIESITVNLIEGDRMDRPGRPDRPDRPDSRYIDVPLYAARRMYGNDRLDLMQFIDMYRYRGYTIREVVIEATPAYRTALLDLLMNGFRMGFTMQVDDFHQRHVVQLQNAVIGRDAASLVLYSRGDLDIRAVTLRLSR